MVPETASAVATGLQTAVTLMVAALLLLLWRVIDRRYLGYWAVGWAALAEGLLVLTFQIAAPAGFASRWLLSVYWICGDVFGFMLYLGCRDFVRETPLRRSDAWIIVPPVLMGLILPGYVGHIDGLFPLHAAIFGGYALIAFIATLQAAAPDGQSLVGIRFLQCGLVMLVALFWHYSAIMGWNYFTQVPALESPVYLRYSSLYDAFVELSVAFAQVVLATDSVRRELADANRQLAAASEQLTQAARTDALTGLLNRRAYDALMDAPDSLTAPGSVAVIDVNDLKPLNDRLGHSAGDAALRAVARALQQRTRLGDPVFRLGGDEFAVILPDVPVEEMIRRMKDMDRVLLGARLPGFDEPVDISIAWGVAEYEVGDLPEAVEIADAEMYRCKKERKGGVQKVRSHSRPTLKLMPL